MRRKRTGILVLTVLRLIWRWVDGSPGPLPDLSPLHRRIIELIHALLYLVLAGLSISGLVLVVQSGVAATLLGLSSEPIPASLSEYLPRRAHGIEARVYIALLVAHVSGVIIHQLSRGDVLSRMGVQIGQTAEWRPRRGAFETTAPAEYRPELGARRSS